MAWGGAVDWVSVIAVESVRSSAAAGADDVVPSPRAASARATRAKDPGERMVGMERFPHMGDLEICRSGAGGARP